MFDISTLLLYLFVIVSTTMLARRSQSRAGYIQETTVSEHGQYNIIKKYFYLAFFIHWFFLAFTNIGTDHEEYLEIIENKALGYLFLGEEVGFNGLCFILYQLTHSSEISIFIIKSITLLLFYRSFYNLRFKINYALTFFVFNTQLYFQGFYLLSMQIGISIIFLAYSCYIEDRKLKGLILAGAAMLFHASSALILPLFALTFLFNLKKKKITKKTIILLGIAVVLIVGSFVTILVDLIQYFPMFEQYTRYDMIDKYSGSGLMIYFNYALLFYFMYHLYKSDTSYNVINLSIIFVISSLCFAILGYKIEVFSRINKYFVCISAMTLPLYQYKIKQIAMNKKINVQNNQFFSLILLFYLAYNGIINFFSLISLKSPSDIGVYHLFSPF